MRITTESATVYRAAGRRWLTKRAAYRAAAKALIQKHCDCEPVGGYLEDPGYPCRYHEDPNHFDELVSLLAYLYEREDAAEKNLDSGAELR